MGRFRVSGFAAAVLLSGGAEAATTHNLGWSDTSGMVATEPNDATDPTSNQFQVGTAGLAPNTDNEQSTDLISTYDPTVATSPGGHSATAAVDNSVEANNAAQANFVYNPETSTATASDEDRMKVIFGRDFSTKSILSEEDQMHLSVDGIGEHGYLALTTTGNEPHNILTDRLAVMPVKRCMQAALDTTAASGDCNKSDPKDDKSTEDTCNATSGCVFSEIDQELSAGTITSVSCDVTDACQQGENAFCKHHALLNIKDAASGSPAPTITLSAGDEACRIAVSTTSALNVVTDCTTDANTMKTFCQSLTEWECRNAGTAPDPRYKPKGASKEDLDISDLDQGEKVRTCYVATAPSIAQSSAYAQRATSRETALFSNPQWPQILGDLGLSVKTSALDGDTITATKRGDPYTTDATGPSGNAATFAFNGLVPDMSYIRPEYDPKNGGYEGIWNSDTHLRFNDDTDIQSGLVTWFWNEEQKEYRPTQASLVMVTDGGETRVIQPDADAFTRSQRQVSLDTMLQFADAIGITAVDNEQTLYEWKLDALQTLLDRINTSHKATAFTYAATGHQLLNLLERFQAHSGATDDLLYYLVTVFSVIQDDFTNAIGVMRAAAFGDEGDDARDVYMGTSTGAPAASAVSNPTKRQKKKALYVPGANQSTAGARNVPRPPKAIRTNGAVYNARYATKASHPDTHKERLETADKNHYTTLENNHSNNTGTIFAGSGQLKSTAKIHPSVADLRPLGKDKMTAYLDTYSFGSDPVRRDSLNSRAPEQGNLNQPLIHNISTGSAATAPGTPGGSWIGEVEGPEGHDVASFALMNSPLGNATYANTLPDQPANETAGTQATYDARRLSASADNAP